MSDDPGKIPPDDLKLLTSLSQLFPVRALAMISEMRQENHKHRKFPQWREKQIAKLGLILTQSASDLVRAYSEEQLTTLAWAARNLLEVSIWIDYCNLSEDRAKRLYDDAMRDLYGLSRAVHRIFELKAGTKDKGLEDKISEFSAFARSMGVDDLADDFKPVSDAARDVGRYEEFRGLNKLLSKFAHPTAWVVHIADSGAEAGYKSMIFMDGAELALKSIFALRRTIRAQYPEIAESKEVSTGDPEN
jgi:hypothetical protein